MRRTHTCGELTIQDLNQMVVLQGWIRKIRKMGALVFIDLRDFYGLTQLVCPTDLALNLKPEFVIEIQGTVVGRKNANPNLKTGAIEIQTTKVKIINQAVLLPFQIEDEVSALEDTRMTYRYLDLRRAKMQKNLQIRSQMNSVIRQSLESQKFLEVETPFLAKSTPEGARDFLVPSRVNQNKFYALPQSPQLFKQLLMVGGIDRYFQIVRCFRDEDLRIDRQPEFTQLDLEMSFATSEDVIYVMENLIQSLLKQVKGVDVSVPFRRMTYRDAIQDYGVDKPDLRYDLKIHDLTSIFKKTAVRLFEPLLASKKVIKGVAINQLLTKTQIKALEETARQNHLKTLAFIKYELEGDTWTGPLASQLTKAEKTALIKEFQIGEQATILVNGGDYATISQAMGAIRVHLGQMFNLADPNRFELLWVVDFPLFEYSEEEQRYVAAHHPFTMPKKESLADFDQNKAAALAAAYDIVMNGFEIGGGSQRITDPEIQKRMFKAVELSPEQVETNFGWFLRAYQYGTPYHAGIALGLDRIAMILATGAESIRDVIAFPKNASGMDLMSNAPDLASEFQLNELHLKLK